MTKHFPIWVHGHHPPITFKIKDKRYSGEQENDGDTTTATNDEISAFQSTPGRGQPFLLLYLPFCMGEGPVCKYVAYLTGQAMSF